MKIAILTLPLHINYGGILQAYAVQKILKDMGHEVITLNLPQHAPHKSIPFHIHFLRFAKTFILYCMGRIEARQIFFPFNNKVKTWNIINCTMKPFINRIIKLSPILNTDSEIETYIKEQKIEACVVGSDQVWRPVYCLRFEWFFLNFLSDDDKVKRIALSASFGTSDWEYTEEQAKTASGLVKKFDAISVRELSGVEFCRKYFKVKGIQLLDPTMMLSPCDYAYVIELDKTNTINASGKIFKYVLDNTKFKQKTIDSISKELNKPVIKIEAEPVLPPYASESTALCLAPGPITQWLRNFQEADFVVTDSFHGVVFSIIHHRPFVVFANDKRGLARIETLLKTFDLEDRLIRNGKLSSQWLMDGIDWDKTDKILESKRHEFRCFLDEALKNRL